MKTRAKLFWASLYAAAMAYLESAVVVYLRQIYYPKGFDFPLAVAPASTILIEIGREGATIAMLTAVGMICGRSALERFAYLMLTFGIWDIFYYVWLKVFIDWPASWLSWDILFLIPLPWVGPVLAPVLISLALIGAAMIIIAREESGRGMVIPRWTWWLEILAGTIIIASFLWDARNIIGGGNPRPFHWGIFGLGLALGLGVFIMLIGRSGARIESRRKGLA